MGGSAGLPLGPLPVLKKATRPFSPQRCHRRLPLVSRATSCANLDRLAWVGCSAPPFQPLLPIELPFRRLRVWHSWQRATSSPVLASRNLIDWANRAVETANSVQRSFIAVHVTYENSPGTGAVQYGYGSPTSFQTAPSGLLLQLTKDISSEGNDNFYPSDHILFGPMDFDQLHTFLEIVRLKSFSKAAQTCYRTQPASAPRCAN